ncbi:3'-5' exonuclease [Alkalibaculum bacchi]|uniref:3'-5' exonuclease n=1 Tax=Alkalibaculum bacchi TaxID=645887 RepID=UPI0026F2FEC5|nr:3'-5' exonuclease [Alkalibaculum bacchi]
MNTIVIDLEFNQASDKATMNLECPFEIIQIGAISLDKNLDCIGVFDRLIKPQIYKEINPYVGSLTGFKIEDFTKEETYSSVFYDFLTFLGDEDIVFCTWGTADMKELFRNTSFYCLPLSKLPNKYINLQPYISRYLHFPSKVSISLKDALKFLKIENESNFHNAYYDAYYTSKIFQKIYNQDMEPQIYAPSPPLRISQPKKLHLNHAKLFAQFEKMMERELTNEEKKIIRLAFFMGKTGQFLE